MKEELEAVRAHVAAGKPLIGIRTASHAFALSRGKIPAPPLAVWQEFDPEVLGGHYTGHYPPGAKTAITAAAGAERHQILDGISPGRLVGNGTLYKVRPLQPDAMPLLIGTVTDKPAEPVAWVRLAGPKKARVFYTSLGHPDDFKNTQFRQLLKNSIAWAVGKQLAPPGLEMRRQRCPENHPNRD